MHVATRGGGPGAIPSFMQATDKQYFQVMFVWLLSWWGVGTICFKNTSWRGYKIKTTLSSISTLEFGGHIECLWWSQARMEIQASQE